MSGDRLTRRDLLVRTAAGAAALKGGSLLTACATDGSGSPDVDSDARPAAPVDPPAEAVHITKGPWVTLQGPDRARLRFETREDVPLPVFVSTESGGRWFEPTRATADLQYARPTIEDGPTPDQPGMHTLHDVILTDLVQDDLVAWEVARGGDEVVAGTFRVPPIGGGTVRVGWIADTMAPWVPAVGVYEHLPKAGLDLLVHGGDITYNSHFLDTWNNFFEKMGPTLQQMPFHVVVGNHDSDLPFEIDEVFDRLFDEQGDTRGTRYHAFTAGAARIILLDTETENFSIVADVMREFIEEQLALVDADPGLKTVIVGFHRPALTLSKYWKRENLPRFDLFHEWAKGRIDIVLAGHAHGFEHFDVDGVHYIVDGCGGSPQYDVDLNVANAEALRPELVTARQHKAQTYGFSVLDIAESGEVTVSKVFAETGEVELSFVIPPRGEG